MKNAETAPFAAESGSPQKAADIRLLAQSHASEAILVMARLMESKDEKTALAAAREILLRAAGKPEQGADEAEAGVVVIRENMPE